ncbi:neural/ectodermal development factor IMP-L2 isoform X1 [Drosophila subobscura]|uniref:neural/ectodermal development factor IMP-L2 isoform X1 n=2 Tax=Drosophila subobscura TaxID=7241 RepID=UPI00155ABC17|nr:neural/ectodermal development factor IMP-L2 isoform X1 [Drosophila subobscura]
MQKMNLSLCALALLLFGSLSSVHSRAVDIVDDSNDVDNSIEAEPEEKPRGRPFEADWLKFTKTPPAKLQQTAGATLEIVCEMMGSQVPTIQWIVGHMPLSEIENLDSNVVSEDAASAIVRVRSVHIIDHMLSESRTYTCVGRTGSKTVYASTVVHPVRSDLGDMRMVREKLYPGPQKPRIIYTEKTHLDLMGSSVMLPCKVHARPRAEVTWLNNENKEVVQNHRYKVLPTGDLLISELKWEDMGNYKCIARNSVGRDSADTFVYPVLKEQD